MGELAGCSVKDRLGLFDEAARMRLRAEIEAVRKTGAPIDIGRTHDEAFDAPDQIREVFTHLRGLDSQLSRVSLSTTKQVCLPRTGKRINRADDRVKNDFRIRWLYGPSATNSVAWFEQRGRASALLTITSAHELTDDNGERRFPTMSGPLNNRVLDHRFDRKIPVIGGLDLRDAVEVTESRFSGRRPVVARTVAERRIRQLGTFVQAPVNPHFRKIVRYCTDSIGIRSRKQLVAERIHRTLDQCGVASPLMMSFGCGTALPILEVLTARREEGHEVPRLLLLDQDPLALASAVTLASDMGLGDHIEVHCRRLFDRFGRPLDLDSVLQGRELHVAEDSGLREYLPDRIYRWLTAKTWQSLAQGGLMSTGNMNIARPQQEVLHGMVGWKPTVQMRPIQHGLDLHARAGVPRKCTTTTVTPEGVYSLVFSVKQ